MATSKDFTALPFDPFSRGLVTDPYPQYRRLREVDPVYWDPALRAWVLTRMAEVTEVLDDESFVAFDIGAPIAEMGRMAGKDFSHLVRAIDAMTFFRNGDDHRAARRAISRAMLRVPFRDLEPVIEGFARESASDLSRRRSFDAVKDFAGVLPSRVMAYILGVSESDRRLLQEIGDDVTRALDIVSLGVYVDVDRRAESVMKHLCKRVEEAV